MGTAEEGEREQRRQPPPDAPPDSTAEDDWSRLREALVGPERRELVRIREQLDASEVGAEEVGRVLPEAILLREREDGRLADALAPTIEGAIQTSVRKNPRGLADAIFPIIGPAIRKSIRQALASMLEGVNRALENSFSPQGLRWRFEARRTGKPFAEVVLLHTLVYRVEQVLLVHTETALLLEQVVAPALVTQDADMVSAMLGAIQDFVRDSFEVGESGGVQQIEYGDLVLMVAQGPKAALAAVVRGTAPASLRATLDETLEEVHRERARELASFDGDATPFLTARPSLERCLQEKQVDQEPNRLVPALASVAAIVVLLALAVVAFRSRAASQVRRDARAALESAPGIVILSAQLTGDTFVVRGLKDPAAQDPARLVERAGLEPPAVRFEWETYHSLEPQFVLSRAREALEPPASARLTFEEGRLSAIGEASHSWIRRARARAAAVPGVVGLDERDLIDTDLRRVMRAKTELENLSVPFPAGSAEPDPGQPAMQSLAAELAALESAALAARAWVRLDLRGRVRPSERSTFGGELGRLRAEAVRRWIEGASSGRILTHLASGDLPDEGVSEAGAVSFRVTLITEE